MKPGLIPTVVVVAVLGGAAAFAACSKTSPEPSADKPSASPTSEPPSTGASPAATPPAEGHASAHAADTPSGGGPEDVAWEAPAAWTSVANANTMRKATYKIAKAAGDAEDAELTVTAALGGVEQNVKRWAGQFGGAEPKTEQRTVNGLKVTVVEIKGTYASGGGPMMMGAPSTPKEKQMLLGAIVDGGERQHFFKMTGPEKTVTAAKKDFDKLVASLRAK
jgi:hypothetical protein